MRAPRTVLTASVGERSVLFSLHAARRWQERRRPSSTVTAALAQLETAVLRNPAAISCRRPHGIELRSVAQQLCTVGWLTLDAEGVVFPLVNYGGELVATTCLVRAA